VAVAVAGRAAVAAVDAGVDARGSDMKKTKIILIRAACAIACVAGFGLATPVHAQAPFGTPQAAADALIDALATHDTDALARVLGKDWRTLLPETEEDPEGLTLFLYKSSQARDVRIDGNRAELVVGSDPWTLPIPMIKGRDGQWQFDLVAGREAIVERRIGANELAAMKAVLAYVDAQREYALRDRTGDGILEYAQKLVASPGKRDGLIWSPSLGDDSPLGEDYLPSKPGEGYHGYRFKILTAQGPSASGGARSYLIGRHMTTGFALLAWPVKYGETGVMSFIVNADGVVFESNLGPQTARIAAGIRQFNPDANWKRSQP
jgi:hypothetical protein